MLNTEDKNNFFQNFSQENKEPIAITGMACRFPKADNPEQFWQLLKNGINAVTEVPENRWNAEDFYSEKSETKGKMNTKWAGFLKDIELFDAGFFDISDNEADSMDPQQRLLMEVTYEALQDAGIVTENIKGEKVGVFIGISSADYSYIHFRNPKQMDMYSISGSAGSVASNRISYFFDFKGPSISIDTACSSSLVAIHLACQSIHENESKMAVAGGVNIILSPMISIGFSQAQATSPDGLCKAFDADANGMVRGEGTGIVVLKPLSQAIKDNDRIYGLIRGSAVNQDGLTNGLLAPSPAGQKEVLENAYQRSGVLPENINYVETHGTGTVLGDPIEAKALGEVLGKNRNDTLKIGSVKTNIGHLEAAAGVAGVIKTLLSLNKKYLPPSLNYSKPNPYIPFEQLHLQVNNKLEKIEKENIFAGVSSFGFGGTNAHIVLENYIKSVENDKQNEKDYLLPLSAHTETAVQDLAKSYIDFLDDEVSLENLAYTASCRRDFHNFRSSITFSNKDELINQLKFLSENNENIQVLPRRKPKLAFVYSGMGSQQSGMGRELLKQPVFKEVILKCNELMKEYHDWSLLNEIENSDKNTEQKIDRVQPTLFALQIGITELLKSFGIKPDAVLGSSVGEVPASYISGMLSLEDAVKVICIRNQAMYKMVGTGAMAIVQMPEKETVEYITKYENVWVSAVNSNSMTVLSGKEDELEKITNALKEKQVFCRMIKGAVAPSHCPMMEPVKDYILDNLKDLKSNNHEITMFSTVYGKTIESIDNNYWWNNVNKPIELRKTILEMEKDKNYLYLEISPHPVLTNFINESVTETGKKPLVMESLRKDKPEYKQVLETVGKLFSHGIKVDFSVLFDNNAQCISLPNYPWQKEYHWIENIDTQDSLGLVSRMNKPVITIKEKSLQYKLDREILKNTEEGNRKELLNEYLRNHVARVLKTSVQEIDINQPLKNLGIGSLMGMELFNRLKGDFEISIPISKFLKGPSIVEISQEIIDDIAGNNTNQSRIHKRNNNLAIPLSFPQQRLWFIEKLESGIFAYNIPAALRFVGEIKPEIIEKSVNEIIKRHEILRTVFTEKDNNPVQVILPELNIKLRMFDISNEQFKEDKYNSLLLSETSELFDLHREPLLRGSIIKLAENEHIVLLTIHHIIADGFSLKIIFDELSRLYKSLLENNQVNLPELPVQYADFSVWQHEQFNQGDYDNQINYWKEKLSNIPTLLELPLDKPRPQVQTFNGAMDSFVLSNSIYEKLNTLSKEKGVTLFTLFLSAFSALLHKYSNQQDIIVGTPIAGRNEPELENLVGIFLNMLALRTEITDDISFSELLENVSKTTLEAYDNQDVPFEKIVEIIKPERSMAHTPVFQVIMALHASVDVDDINDIKINYLDVDMKTAKFDLVLSFIPDKDHLRGAFEYNTDLFLPETIENIKNQYFNLLEEICKNPDLKISELKLLTIEQEKEIIDNFSFGKITENINTNVVELFEKQVNIHPDKIAISENEKTISYFALNSQVNKIANYLGSLNLDKNYPVAIYSERSIDLITAIIGVLKSGMFYLPLDPAYPITRNKIILEDSKVEFVLTQDKFIDDFDNTKAESINKILDLDLSKNNPENKINETAYVIYTSGSTGIPKGVEITHDNLINLVNWHQREYQISENDNSSLLAGVSFDASVWEIFPYLTVGATINIPEKSVMEKSSSLINWFDEKEISITFIPTPLLEVLLDEDWSAVKSLKKVLTGGDKLTKKIKADLPFRLFNHYGPTEATVVSTACEIKADKKITIGKPIDNTEVYILDDNFNLVPIGVTGEIYLGGKSLAKGYFNHPELTDKNFVENKLIYPGRLISKSKKFYKTGDRGSWTKNGEIEYIGRNDSQVKIRGVRIELAEVEEAIYSFSKVKECFVDVYEKAEQKYIVAYVVTKNISELAEYLKEKLPDAAQPKLIYLGRLPLTPNGKIDKTALPEPKFAESKNILAKTNIEKELLKIWQEVLNTNNISVDTNFFDLGGHSLLAIQMMDKISRKFQVDLSLKELFSSPTIQSVARLIEKQQENLADKFVLPIISFDEINQFQPFPLTDVQQAYWLGRGNDFQLGNVSAHAYLEISINNFAIDKFEKAFQKIINRHPMLRTIILKDGTQKVLENVPEFKLKINDLKNSENQEKEFLVIRDKLSHEVLESDKYPLFNLSTSLIDSEKTILHISIDGLIADALSMVIIGKELSGIYKNDDLILPDLNITFRDYVLAEKQLFNTAIFEKSKNYWLNRIDNLPSAPQLPLAINPADLNNPKFTRLSGKLDKEKWSRIKKYSADLNVTPSVVLLSAFSKVLGLYSKTKHFTLNLTLFNRLPLHEKIMEIVGDFTSLNLLEIDQTKVENFEQLTKSVQEQLWNDIDHRYTGGVWVLREIAKLKGRESASMPVVFTSMLSEQGSFNNSDFLGEISFSITQTPQVWLDHQVTESEGNLLFNWDFPAELFPENMLHDLFDIYNIFLENISALNVNWNQIKNLSISEQQLTDREKIKSVEKVFPEKLLHELFFDNVKIKANEKAIITSELNITYQQLALMVNNLADKLRKSGVKPNQLVAVVMAKGWEQVVATLAINLAGGAYLPINPEHPKDRVDYLLELCEVKVAITQERWQKEFLFPENIEVFSISKADIGNTQEIEQVESINNPDDLAYVIFTSGSTGLPKGVMISHRGAVNTIFDVNERFNITDNDKVFAISSLNFDLSVYDFFGTLAAGATIVIPDDGTSRDPEHWSKLMIKENVTVWNSVPTLMKMYTEYCKGNPENRWNKSLKTVMMSGDWIPLSLPNDIWSFNPEINIISMGGATEASIWSIFYNIKEVSADWKSIPYGKPLSNQSFHILNDDFEPCPVYVPGNLYIGGVGLALGYYKDKEKTEKSFIINPLTGERLYKTGDLGRYLPDGNIEFLGREDSQVKIQGHRIELGEVEAAILQHPAIEDGIVLAYGETRGEKYLVGYVQFENQSVADQEIIDFMESKLPCYMVPSIFVHLDKIPLTANGKVDRKSLPVPLREKDNSTEEELKNIDQNLLNKISEMVKQILEIDFIDPKADLLSMGANSIDIVKLANLLEQEFGFCPKMGDIFRLKNIIHLVKFYEDNRNQIKVTTEIKEGQIILDPSEREKFKNQRRSVRNNLSGKTISLESENTDNFSQYYSSRVFSQQAVNKANFGKLLSNLKEISLNNSFKYQYASAGSLYPVQVYIHVKENRIEGIEQGIYYYNPQKHNLVFISENNSESEIHFPANSAIYEQSAFSIYLIADLRGIEPLYGNSSVEYSYLEGGSISQVLRQNASKYNIGLCLIGQVNSDKVKEILALDEKYLFLITLLGGEISSYKDNIGFTFIEENSEDEWEEITI